MGVSDTVNAVVGSALSNINFQNKASTSIMKKAMDYSAMVNSQILKGLPDVQSLSSMEGVGQNIDVYA